MVRNVCTILSTITVPTKLWIHLVSRLTDTSITFQVNIRIQYIKFCTYLLYQPKYGFI